MTEPHPGFIYFLECGGQIKIGYTRDWHRRFQSLKSANANKIDVLAVMKGTRQEEGDIHARFQAHRVHGEWYRAEQDILDFIDEVELHGRTV